MPFPSSERQRAVQKAGCYTTANSSSWIAAQARLEVAEQPEKPLSMKMLMSPDSSKLHAGTLSTVKQRTSINSENKVVQSQKLIQWDALKCVLDVHLSRAQITVEAYLVAGISLK